MTKWLTKVLFSMALVVGGILGLQLHAHTASSEPIFANIFAVKNTAATLAIGPIRLPNPTNTTTGTETKPTETQQTTTPDASNSEGDCTSSDSAAAGCVDKYTTRYVTNGSDGKPNVNFCKISPSYVRQLCSGLSGAGCKSVIEDLVGSLTNAEGANSVPGTCSDGYRGAVSCYPKGVQVRTTNAIQIAAAVASTGSWKCCKKGSTTCSDGSQNPDLISDADLDPSDTKGEVVRVSDTNNNSTVGGGEVVGTDAVYTDTQGTVDRAADMGGGGGHNTDTSGTAVRTDTSGTTARTDTPGSAVRSDTPGSTVRSDTPGTVARTTDVSGAPTHTPSATPTRVTPTPDGRGLAIQRTQGTPNPYQSLRTARSLQNPESFIQRFAGDSPLAQLARFATGQAALRNTPEGDPSGEPRVIYVTPEYNVDRETKSVQEIASDISAQTPSALARVDHFARTLTAVGGPNSVDTENKAYGRIQDLIVEDEAIRALRVAEEEGKRAKNAVFCRANETAESCNTRREEKAKEVERRVFVEELEKRVLPQTAIEHFLAVYDGWVRPSPAPDTFATSTLGTLHAQDINPLAQYEITTGGSNFVLWVVESVADAASAAVDALVNLITGGDDEDAGTTDAEGEILQEN